MRLSDSALSNSINPVGGLGLLLTVAICATAGYLKSVDMQNCGLLVGIAAYAYTMAVTTYLAFRREIPRMCIGDNIYNTRLLTLLYAIVLWGYSWGNFFMINGEKVGFREMSIGVTICWVWLWVLSRLPKKEEPKQKPPGGTG